MKVINELKRDYILKGIGQPEFYLGGNVHELMEEFTNEGSKTYIKMQFPNLRP